MIKIIKLVNGEEIVGDMTGKKQDHILLKNPMAIVYRYHPMASFPHIKLVKYMIFSKEEVLSFNKVDIINITNPRDSFVDYYLFVLSALNGSEENIDAELRDAVNHEKESKEKFYSSLLDQLPRSDKFN